MGYPATPNVPPNMPPNVLPTLPQMKKQCVFVLEELIEAAVERILLDQRIIRADEIAHRALLEPLTMQPPFTAGIDQPIAHQGLQNVLPARTFARIGQTRRKEKIEFELPIEMTGQKAGAPLPRPMQLHLVEPHLHAIGFGMVRHGPFGRKQRQLTMMSAVFVEGLDDPTPGVALAVVDLTKIQHGTLHHLAAGAALALDDAPIAMLFAVLEPSRELQVHEQRFYTKATSTKDTWSSLQPFLP